MTLQTRRTSSRIKRQVARRAFVPFAIAVISAAVLPLVAAGAAEPGAIFTEVGSLERFPADARKRLGDEFVPTFASLRTEDGDATYLGAGGTLIAVPSMRQLWQLFPNQSPDAMKVAVRDLDTLEIKHAMTLPTTVERATTATIPGDWAHAIDDEHGRLFLVTGAQKHILEVDLRTFAITLRPFFPGAAPPTFTSLVSKLTIGGLTYDPYADDLLLLLGGPSGNSAANTNTFLYTMDVTNPPTPPEPGRLRQLRACSGPLTSVDVGGDTYGWQMLVTTTQLFVPCQRAGHTGIVIKLTRPAPADPREPSTLAQPEEIAAGPVYVETVFADQQSGRLFMVTTRREIWAFEASTMSFIGVVASGIENTDTRTGYGFDPTTGRLFFQSRSFGLGVVEGRFFPIPQARTLGNYTLGHERIVVDAPTRRIFVLEQEMLLKAEKYRIYKTDDAPTPPPPVDPDRNTTDMDERENVTERRYFSSGSGYGTRVLLAKGFSTVAPAPALGVVAPTAEAIDKTMNSDCGYTDRDFVAGRVMKAEYETGSTAAAAIAVNVDDSTKQDVDKPGRCDIRIKRAGVGEFEGVFIDQLDDATQADDPETKDEQESRWRWGPAECASNEENVPDGPSRGVDDDFGPSEVRCPSPGGELSARAEGALRLDLAVEVEDVWTTTKIERTSKGVRSTVESVAKDIRLAGGAIRFAEIRSKATSVSNGRPSKDPMSTHVVTVKGAVVNGTTICKTCDDLTSLVDTLNIAAAGRAVFRAGSGVNSGRDEKLLTGSERGALTAVQKSPARQASDRALVGDFTTEIPALDMTVFNDNTQWGRARQVYQFAGVSTAATYNIVLRPTGLPGDGGGFGGFPGIDGDGNPFSGSTEGAGGTGAFGNASSDGDDNPSGIAGVLRALARGIRLFFTNPRHSLLLLTAWALFSMPAVLARRRRLLGLARAQ